MVGVEDTSRGGRRHGGEYGVEVFAQVLLWEEVKRRGLRCVCVCSCVWWGGDTFTREKNALPRLNRHQSGVLCIKKLSNSIMSDPAMCFFMSAEK